MYEQSQYADLERTLGEVSPLLEAAQWGDFVPWSDYPSNDWPDILPSGRFASYFATLSDREDGRYRPIYDNELDLARQLAMVRRVIGMNELTEAVTTALKVYTFGAGIDIGVEAANNQMTPPRVVDAVKRIVERFAEQNNLVNNLDVEMHLRSINDGECILPIERDGNKILCDPVETVQLTQPRSSEIYHDYLVDKFAIDTDSFVPSWNFGVLTTKRRTSRPLAYHVVFNGAGSDYEIYPSDELVHVKRNTPRNAKRGVSDWLAIKDRLIQCPKLITNMAHGAALQSAIAWIENNPPGTTQAQAAGIGNPGKPPQPVPNGFNSFRQERQMVYGPGSILRPSAGRTYVPGPMGAERNQGFDVVNQILIQMIGTRWLMPYSMISGDASNNNFASSLVAESPFVKAREWDQQFYGGAIKSLLWKVVTMAWKLGWLDTGGIPFEQLERYVDIKVTFTSPATRDRSALVDQLTKEVALGATSLKTASTELGRDFEEEVALGAKPEAVALPVDPKSNQVPPEAGAKPQMVNPHSLKPTKPDSALDQDKVSAMADSLKSGHKLGPVKIDESNNVLDGHHTLAAHKKAGLPVPAVVIAKKDSTPGGINAPAARQQDRNTRAINKTLEGFQSGKVTRVVAKGILVGYGVPDATAEEFLNDAAKGKIDVPKVAQTAQLESINEAAIEMFLLLEEGNPNHGADGKFASGGGSGGVSLKKSVGQIAKMKQPPPPEKKLNVKAARAKEAYNPATKEKQDISEAMEHQVAAALGGTKSGDNRPYDVVSKSGNVGVEVKTLHDAKEHRINMRKDSRQRKEAWVSENKKRSGWIVAIDNRDQFQNGAHADKYSGHKFYVYKGAKAVSLNQMTKADDLGHVKRIMGIK